MKRILGIVLSVIVALISALLYLAEKVYNKKHVKCNSDKYDDEYDWK